VGEQVNGSGLSSVSGIELNLSYNDILRVPDFETYDVLINNTDVGSFTINGTNDDGIHSVTNSYSFSAVSGPDYTVLFKITSPTIPPGQGSFGWYHDGSSTFTLTAVPEPSYFGLFAAGLAGALVLRRRLTRR
jgi:hypothetical protein